MVVLFGTLKVQSFILTEVSDCGLLIAVTSSFFFQKLNRRKVGPVLPPTERVCPPTLRGRSVYLPYKMDPTPYGEKPYPPPLREKSVHPTKWSVPHPLREGSVPPAYGTSPYPNLIQTRSIPSQLQKKMLEQMEKI